MLIAGAERLTVPPLMERLESPEQYEGYACAGDGSASNFYRCIIEKVCSWGKIYRVSVSSPLGLRTPQCCSASAIACYLHHWHGTLVVLYCRS